MWITGRGRGRARTEGVGVREDGARGGGGGRTGGSEWSGGGGRTGGGGSGSGGGEDTGGGGSGVETVVVTGVTVWTGGVASGTDPFFTGKL